MEEPKDYSQQTGARMVIVAYKPKPGKEDALLQLTREHVPLLRGEGLATDWPVTACRAADGTIIEVFEWAPLAIGAAHTNPVVLKLWERYAEVCDYLPLNQLPEAAEMFAGFDRLSFRAERNCGWRVVYLCWGALRPM